MPFILPISAVIATKDRAEILKRTLCSLLNGTTIPAEIIIIDATKHSSPQKFPSPSKIDFAHLPAKVVGAAPQRNQGVLLAKHQNILFLDDDILLENQTIEFLYTALLSDNSIGGVSSMIKNQSYIPPGRISRSLLAFLNGKALSSYAGRCIGPAKNLLPEDSDSLDEIVFVDWLNTTCTLYRRQSLPSPPFSDFFQGASFAEDLALSLVVAKHWKLANARTAKIFHDSQPGSHKSNQVAHSEMEVINRHHIMTNILERRSMGDHLRLLALNLFEAMASAYTGNGNPPARLIGVANGWKKILTAR